MSWDVANVCIEREFGSTTRTQLMFSADSAVDEQAESTLAFEFNAA